MVDRVGSMDELAEKQAREKIGAERLQFVMSQMWGFRHVNENRRVNSCRKRFRQEDGAAVWPMCSRRAAGGLRAAGALEDNHLRGRSARALHGCVAHIDGVITGKPKDILRSRAFRPTRRPEFARRSRRAAPRFAICPNIRPT
jgi:hypothetical protein